MSDGMSHEDENMLLKIECNEQREAKEAAYQLIYQQKEEIERWKKQAEVFATTADRHRMHEKRQDEVIRELVTALKKLGGNKEAEEALALLQK